MKNLESKPKPSKSASKTITPRMMKKILAGVRKKMIAEDQKKGIFEKYDFTLPHHIKSRSTDDLIREMGPRVVGDVYRFPDTKFKATPAEPLNTDEEVKRARQAYRKPQVEKDVVSSAAEAEIALANLARLARSGNGKALWQFAALVRNAVAGLNEIALGNPAAVAPFARQTDRWPMLRSTAPLLCDDDALLDKIELGKAAGVQLDKYSKWKPDYAATVANKLIQHIQFIRLENPYCLNAGQKIEFSKFVQPFNKDTAPHWWKFAEKFLLTTYPKPEEVAELDALVTAKSKRKFPSTRRANILEKIQARFLHLATYPS